MIESIGNVLLDTQNSTVQRAGVSADDFLKILLAQLSFQDPLKPLDNQEYVTQLAQFTNLEQTRTVATNVEALLTLESGNQAVGLLGKTVEIVGESGAGSTVGVVTTVGFNNGVPALTVRGADGAILTDIPMSQISVIR